MNESRTVPSRRAVLVDLNMMVSTGGGRERTEGEFDALLGGAGLRLKRIVRMPIPDCLVEAVPA